MMPAMCVPWPYVSRYRTVEPCDSNDRSGPLTMCADGSPGTGATPVSMSAMPTPVPSTPDGTPIAFATSDIDTDVVPDVVLIHTASRATATPAVPTAPAGT